MTDNEKLTVLTGMTGETDESALTAYLSLAKSKLMHRLYPYHEELDELPGKYDMVQVEAAAYLLNKRGAEGETSHSENGISRAYETGDLPSSLLQQLTPQAGMFSWRAE